MFVFLLCENYRCHCPMLAEAAISGPSNRNDRCVRLVSQVTMTRDPFVWKCYHLPQWTKELVAFGRGYSLCDLEFAPVDTTIGRNLVSENQDEPGCLVESVTGKLPKSELLLHCRPPWSLPKEVILTPEHTRTSDPPEIFSAARAIAGEWRSDRWSCLLCEANHHGNLFPGHRMPP